MSPAPRRPKVRFGKTGYVIVDLCWHGKRATKYVHRLVLEAFVGPAPDGMECRHLDGSRDNNRLSNLAWGTTRENIADQVGHGTRVEWTPPDEPKEIVFRNDFLPVEVIDPTEVWKPVPGYPWYFVSSHGRFRTTLGKGARIGDAARKHSNHLRPMKGVSGAYGHVHLIFRGYDGLGRRLQAHRVVYEAFCGPMPEGLLCSHLDGKPENNHVANLAPATSKQNQADRIAHGTANRGDDSVNSILNSVQVRSLYLRYKAGERGADLAREFRCSPQLVCDIAKKRAWKHLTDAID